MDKTVKVGLGVLAGSALLYGVYRGYLSHKKKQLDKKIKAKEQQDADVDDVVNKSMKGIYDRAILSGSKEFFEVYDSER